MVTLWDVFMDRDTLLDGEELMEMLGAIENEEDSVAVMVKFVEDDAVEVRVVDNDDDGLWLTVVDSVPELLLDSDVLNDKVRDILLVMVDETDDDVVLV